ncbi:MAG: PKD domain-containing protein [Acidobacteria bacterium]|nr:PKD domain-containing protein [Acidobacteriota bacterium]
MILVLAMGITGAFGAEIVPPRDLGELAIVSRSVVLARAVSSRVVPGPYIPHTVTRFERIEQVGGERTGATFEVKEPGGAFDGVAAQVDGSPRFSEGKVYLLFLDHVTSALWRVRCLAWGAFEQAGTGREKILMPVAQRRQVGVIRRFDVEIPGVYSEDRLISHLRDVIRGRARWNGPSVLVPDAGGPSASAQDAPSVCAFMTYSEDGDGIRWFAFADGTAATIMATTPGQDGLDDGGAGAVSGAVGAWTNDPDSKILLNYGGTTAQQVSCGSGDDYQGNAVIFNDPCDDIAALNNCSGTLAYGGPVFSTATQEFDGTPWHPALKLFVVVNDGAQCVGAVNFAEVMTHELGHGLGFGHHHDSNATMYSQCCHYPRGAALASTDSACAAYLYPDGSQASPPAAPGSLTAQAVAENQITLSWIDNSSDEDGFHVYRSTGAAFSLVSATAANVQSFIDTGVGPCTAAQYYVTAFNGAGESAASDTAVATTPGSPPQAPVDLQATSSSPDLVELSWSNSSPGQTSVEIDRSAGGGAFVQRAILAGSSTRFSDRSVTPGAVYQYRLRASNSCGASSWSQVVEVAVPEAQGGLMADFSIAPARPWTGEEATLTSGASGDPETFSWAFGDGGHATGPSVSHIFAQPGTYTVTLEVTKGATSATAHRQVVVLRAPSVVPAAAHTPGRLGTFWKTDLVLLGRTAAGSSGRLVLRDEDGLAIASMPYTVPSGHLVELGDVVGTMGAGQAAGSLDVEVTSGVMPGITTRTFTPGPAGTYGQSIPLEMPQRPGTVYLTGIRGTPAYRTDFGVASSSESVLHVTTTLFTSRGRVTGPTLGLAPHAHAQWNLTALVGKPALEDVGAASLAVTIDQPAVVYVSVIDNDSGDPAYIAAGRASTRLLIPVIGRGPGRNGTSWDSELMIFNPGSTTAHLELVYLPADHDNSGGGLAVSETLAPGETRRFDHAPLSLWGVQRGLGSVRISSGTPVVASARVVTPRLDGPGTMGQTVPAVDLDHLGLRHGVIAWVRWGGAFRTNAGLVNLGSAPLDVTLRLHGANGVTLGEAAVTVPPASLLHRSLEDLFGAGVLQGEGQGWIEAVPPSEELLLYATQVDNLSGDPVNVAGQ